MVVIRKVESRPWHFQPVHGALPLSAPAARPEQLPVQPAELPAAALPRPVLPPVWCSRDAFPLSEIGAAVASAQDIGMVGIA